MARLVRMLRAIKENMVRKVNLKNHERELLRKVARMVHEPQQW